LPEKLTQRRLRLLGFFPLAFFTAQALHYWQINQLGHTLWMCNIGNLLLAIALLTEQAVLIRVAAVWMVPGVLVWFAYVVPTWGMLFTGKFSYTELFGVMTSTFAHLGGFAVGIIGLRKVGVELQTWAYAFVWYFIVQTISRLITPAVLNVNLAHGIQPGWESFFDSYLKFWLVLSLLVGLCLWLLTLLLTKLWPAAQVSHEPAASA
jgi:hypothetical protein